MSSRLEAVLLDAGNTILFMDETAVAERLAAAGLDVTAANVEQAHARARARYDAELRAGVRRDAPTWREPLLDELGVTDREPRAEALEGLLSLHDAHLLFRRVPLGVRSALARLRADGFRLGIVSNSEGLLVELLRRVGLAGVFEVVIDSGVLGIEKPDARIFAHALSAIGVTASAAVHVGDLVSQDVEGARGAGIAAVLVDEHGRGEPPLGVPVIPSVADLPGLLARGLDHGVVKPAAGRRAPSVRARSVTGD